ncbi:MAG: HD domain-containing phosphohydrolase [Limnochordales bacterium]|nr:MAG: hypothetical protein DIU83_08645 [Bacillota bacterium]
MRRINISYAPPGVVLARPLVDERGAYVLASGQALTPAVRERLWERGFRYAYVESLGFENLVVHEPLEPQTFMRARQLARQLMDGARTAAASLEVPVQELSDLAADACEELSRIPAGRGFLLYPEWGSVMDKRIAFAVNAGVVAAMVGRAMEGVEAARHLFTAALLQDLGLWRVERTPDHVAVSREMLRPQANVSALVKAIVAQHHERLDGSGYPAGKTGADLHPLGRIMSVVVAYLELLSDGVLPHEAQEALMAGAGTEFDLDAVKTLMRYVPGYPAGTVVRLSGGRHAVVVDAGAPGLNRPRVRLLPRDFWRAGEEPATEEDLERARAEIEELDLAGLYTMTIEAVLE